MSVLSKAKQIVPYPSDIDIRNRELQITANHDTMRSILSRLNDVSREYGRLLGASAALLFLVDWTIQLTPSWIRPITWTTIIFFAILAGIRIRVVAQAETTVLTVTTPEPSVTIEDDGTP